MVFYRVEVLLNCPIGMETFVGKLIGKPFLRYSGIIVID